MSDERNLTTPKKIEALAAAIDGLLKWQESQARLAEQRKFRRRPQREVPRE